MVEPGDSAAADDAGLGTGDVVPLEEEASGAGDDVSSSFPLDSSRFNGNYSFRVQLPAAISDPTDVHTIFQVNVKSAEGQQWGLAWVTPLNEAPFPDGFCFEDRPNCADGTVQVEVEVGPDRDLLTFCTPEETFGNATGLIFGAIIVTFPEGGAPVTETIADGTVIPVGTDERDPRQ